MLRALLPILALLLGAAAAGSLLLGVQAAAGVPIPAQAGSEWEIVAGYNTGTHSEADRQDPYAIDIVRLDAPTADSPVLAPTAGIIGYVSTDCLTIRDHAGMGHLLCHINPRQGLTRGAQVEIGEQIGTVWPNGYGNNGGLAHIHYAVHHSQGAGQLGRTVPFTGPYTIEGIELHPGNQANLHAGTHFTSTNRPNWQPPTTQETDDDSDHSADSSASGDTSNGGSGAADGASGSGDTSASGGSSNADGSAGDGSADSSGNGDTSANGGGSADGSAGSSGSGGTSANGGGSADGSAGSSSSGGTSANGGGSADGSAGSSGSGGTSANGGGSADGSAGSGAGSGADGGAGDGSAGSGADGSAGSSGSGGTSANGGGSAGSGADGGAGDGSADGGSADGGSASDAQTSTAAEHEHGHDHEREATTATARRSATQAVIGGWRMLAIDRQITLSGLWSKRGATLTSLFYWDRNNQNWQRYAPHIPGGAAAANLTLQPGDAVLGAVQDGAAWLPRITPAPTPPTLQLQAGWNLVSWHGPTTPIAEALASLTPSLTAAHLWNNETQQYHPWTPTPSTTDTPTQIPPATTLWLHLTTPHPWPQHP